MPTPNGATWLKTANAAQALNMNPQYLLRKLKQLEKDDYVQDGIHFQKNGTSKNCHYQFEVEAFRKVLSKWRAPQTKE